MVCGVLAASACGGGGGSDGDGGSGGWDGGSGDGGGGGPTLMELCDGSCESGSETCAEEGADFDVTRCVEQCMAHADADTRNGTDCLYTASGCDVAKQCIEDWWTEEPDVPSSPGGFINAFADAYCDRKHNGCCDDAESTDMWAASDEGPLGGCSFGLDNAPMDNAFESSIEAGRMVFHAEEIEACLERVANISCDELNWRHADEDAYTRCTDVLEPTVAIGGACLLDADCVSGFCRGGDYYGDDQGTCAEVFAEGEDCAGREGICGDGLYCDGTCVPKLAPGESCSGDYDCASHKCDLGGSLECQGPVCDGS